MPGSRSRADRTRRSGCCGSALGNHERRLAGRDEGGNEIGSVWGRRYSGGSGGLFRMKPVVAITMGDPSGVGAEIVVKALADPELAALANWVVVGDTRILKMAGEIANA